MKRTILAGGIVSVMLLACGCSSENNYYGRPVPHARPGVPGPARPGHPGPGVKAGHPGPGVKAGHPGPGVKAGHPGPGVKAGHPAGQKEPAGAKDKPGKPAPAPEKK